MAYSRRKTRARPILSETHAQNTRPVPLKMEITPTIPAAANGDTFASCWASGDAWLITMIPAETFRNSMNHNSQNCHVRIAWDTEKSTVVAAFSTAPVGTQPSGRHP